MEIKTVKRDIPEYRENRNDRFRVRYKDKSTFEELHIIVCRLKTNETITYKFKSIDLPDKDSIHFTTKVTDDKFEVIWDRFNEI